MTDPDTPEHTASTAADEAQPRQVDPGLRTAIDDVSYGLVVMLTRLSGSYAGRGTDVESGEFAATATLGPVAGRGAMRLDLSIEGPEPYAEYGFFGRGEHGPLVYVGVSTNAPMLRRFDLRRTEAGPDYARAVLGWGGPTADQAGFREELTVTVYADSDLALAWAWGEPGGEFAPRSEVRLSPV